MEDVSDLLDAAAHLTSSVASELNDMEGIEHAGGILELIVDGVLAVPGRGSSLRLALPRTSLFRAWPASSHARCQTCLGPGLIKWAVGWSFPRVVHDAGEFTWAPAASVLVVPHASHQPPAPEPLRNGRGSDAACRHGLIWDHTVFHVVASCRANPAMVAPSKRSCRIAQRIARVPRRARGLAPSRCAPGMSPSGRWFRGISSAVLCHRIRTGTPAQGASITSTTTRPWP